MTFLQATVLAFLPNVALFCLSYNSNKNFIFLVSFMPAVRGVRQGTSNSRMYLNCLLFGQGSHCSLVTFILLCTSNNILCEDSKFVDY